MKKQVQTGLVPPPPAPQIVPGAQEDLCSTGYFHPMQMGGNGKIKYYIAKIPFHLIVQTLGEAVKVVTGLRKPGSRRCGCRASANCCSKDEVCVLGFFFFL